MTNKIQKDYLYSYHLMEDSTFNQGHGVKGLCKINHEISAMVVSDADQRRQKSKDWRRNCSPDELLKFTVANQLTEKAIQASTKTTLLNHNLNIVLQRSQAIYQIMDDSF